MKTRFAGRLAWIATVVLGGMSAGHAATYYVDSVAGQNANDGLSETSAWKDLYRVNKQVLQPGESVLFKRGGTWRGSLQMQGGSQAGGVVTYGAYGVGDKPKLLGSATLNNQNDWTDAGNQIWVSKSNALSGERVGNPEFTSNTAGWQSWNPKNIISFSRDTSNSSNPSVKVDLKSKADGDTTGDAQLYTQVGSIVAGQCYRLSFNAVSSVQFAPKGAIALLVQNSSPGTGVGAILNAPAMPTIGTSWDSYSVLYRAVINVSDGRIGFQLGGAATEATTLNIDSVSFTQVDCDRVMTADVGNLIFNGGTAVGIKVYNETDLDQDGKFWFDPKKLQIKIKSFDNPAVRYSQIEAAQNSTIVKVNEAYRKSYILLQDLDLRYGGAHAVGFGGGTANVTVQRLDISYIGGSYLGSSTLPPTTRYGNGIQFWNYGANLVVRDNHLSHIYDSALTAQGQTELPDTVVFNNISFTGNYIANVEQCYELWNQGKGSGSKSDNISFTQNTCVDAGHGWSHEQRIGKAGFGVLMYAAIAPMSNITIKNNVFYKPTESVVYINLPWIGYQNIDFSGNCFYADPNAVPGGGWLLVESGNLNGVPRNLSTIKPSDFIGEFTSAATSYFGDPMLLASPSGELLPAAGSPCEGKGYLPQSGN